MTTRTTSRQVLVGMPERLRAAARAVGDTREAYDAARELRDALIVQAIDEGMQQNAVARAAGVSRSRVVAIIADTGEPDAA